MKRAICLFIVIMCVAFLITGCDNSRNVTIDVASSVNFRCEVYISDSDESFTLNENDSTYLFERSFENKENATRLKDGVGIGTSFIKIYFVGDCVDNAPIKDNKADYGRFTIFSNDTVRFEYDTASEYYQFERGFYNFINNYILIFAEK